MKVNNDFNRDSLIALLETRVVDLKFYKSDDSLREMRATLRKDYVPETINQIYENSVIVWDVEKKDLRSFRLDRLFEVI